MDNREVEDLIAQTIQTFKDKKFLKVDDLEVGTVYNFHNLEFMKTQYGAKLTGVVAVEGGDKTYIFPSYIQNFFEDVKLGSNVTINLKYTGFVASGQHKIAEFDLIKN